MLLLCCVYVCVCLYIDWAIVIVIFVISFLCHRSTCVRIIIPSKNDYFIRFIVYEFSGLSVFSFFVVCCMNVFFSVVALFIYLFVWGQFEEIRHWYDVNTSKMGYFRAFYFLLLFFRWSSNCGSISCINEIFRLICHHSTLLARIFLSLSIVFFSNIHVQRFVFNKLKLNRWLDWIKCLIVKSKKETHQLLFGVVGEEKEEFKVKKNISLQIEK